jgi:hypothetical protein
MSKPNPHRRRSSASSIGVTMKRDAEGAYVDTHALDYASKRGCSDPACTLKPEEHTGMGIEPMCHETNKVTAFYNGLTKMLEIECGICGREIIRVKVATEPKPEPPEVNL